MSGNVTSRGLAFRSVSAVSEAKRQSALFILKKHVAQRCLHDFVKQAWHVVEPEIPFADNWHIKAICDHLEALLDGRIEPQLLANVPPGTSKSLIVCVFFPAWVWGPKGMPGKRFLTASYADVLGIRDAVRTRDLVMSEWFQSRWKVTLKDDQNAKTRYDTNAGGWRIVGSITGRGIGEHPDFFCLAPETKLKTRHGEVAIQTLVESRSETEVLSYNHHTKENEWRRITGHSKTPGDRTFKISTKSVSVIATARHPFFVRGKGYVAASSLQRGDRLVSAVSLRKGVPITQSEHPSEVLLLPVLLSDAPAKVGALQAMRHANKSMSGKTLQDEGGEVLQSPMPRRLHQRHESSSLQRALHPALRTVRKGNETGILFLQMLKERSETGAESLRSLPHDAKGPRQGVGCSSHRLQQEEQRTAESDCHLSILPRRTSRRNAIKSVLDGEIIVSVEEISPLEWAYNVSIDGNRNYYANGVLTHNCADDPHNVLQAESEADRLTVTRWFEGVFCVRGAVRDAKRILIMQRLHSADCSGVALEKGGWCHLCLPMEYEATDTKMIDGKDVIVPKEKVPTRIGFIDPRTEDGELLWPKVYTREKVDNLKVNLGLYNAAGQLQQRPAPRGGGKFKREWFEILNVCPPLMKLIRYWDKAGTSGGTGAETAGALIGEYIDSSVAIESMRVKYIIVGILHNRTQAAEREAIIKQTAELDRLRYGHVTTWVEQEPGPIWETELVQLANGGKKILKDITEGDKVINKSGNISKVTRTIDNGVLQSLKITTESGRIVHPALSHPFLTLRGWVTAQDITLNDSLALSAGVRIIPTADATADDCRLAGYFIGDGCCVLGKNGSPVANIVCSEPIEGQDILALTARMGFTCRIVGKKQWVYSLSGGIRDWLWKRELAGKRTENKEVPEWVMKSENAVAANFIGAYFACDGSVSIKDKRLEFYSTSRKLLEQVSSLLLRFGIYGRLRTRNYSSEVQRTRRVMYRFSISRGDDSVARFAEHIPVPGRKGLLISGITRTAFETDLIADRVVSIESAGGLPCRCISVDSESSFVCNDFVVHNSGGKESAEGTVANLVGFDCKFERVTGEKVVRADPMASQASVGKIKLLAGEWNSQFLDEIETFPMGKLKDFVDACSGAFNKLWQPGGGISSVSQIRTGRRHAMAEN